MPQDGHVARMPPGVVFELPDRGRFEGHAHPQHQLAFATRGVLTISVGDRTWVLPPTRALWVPAGIVHSLEVRGDTTMASAYVEPSQCPLHWPVPTVVAATGLAGALAHHLSAAGLPAEQRCRAEAVLWDVIEAIVVPSLALVWPSDDRARRVAAGIVAAVHDDRPLDAWGREVGASARTLARLFRAETGLGVGAWRRRARVAASLPLLAAGEPVAVVAGAVGYADPSAFVSAFRAEVGITPARCFG